MAGVEIYVDAFINLLLSGKLSNANLSNMNLTDGTQSKLQTVVSGLDPIRSLLFVAGQKPMEERFQNWLYNVLDLVTDIHYLLDDIKYGHNMGSKLDVILMKLDKLVKEKNSLDFDSYFEAAHGRRYMGYGSTAASITVGQEGDKHALLRKLLENQPRNRNATILSIVAMAGMGKTILAQALYNEEEVIEHFDVRVWISVSGSFNVFNVSKLIFHDIEKRNFSGTGIFELQGALAQTLSNKRFLIVLDDVSNVDLEAVGIFRDPFDRAAPGSKIIVTTRHTLVAEALNSDETHHMEILSNEDALSLLSQCADLDSNPTRRVHAKNILKISAGLPIALKSFGEFLGTKFLGTRNEHWELLKSGRLNIPNLKVIYHSLPPHLKLMYAYCSLFPKGYMFDKDELILLWMAEGFLFKPASAESMESFGRRCFEELKSVTLFLNSTKDKSSYTLHDLAYYAANSVAGKFFFMLDDKVIVENTNEDFRKLRHFSFIRQRFGVYKIFKGLGSARTLRTFLAVSMRIDGRQSSFILNNVLADLLPRLLYLRVLSLTNYSITEVPQCIGVLKHLRYLNCSQTNISYIPEQVSDLCNLQSLLLRGCEKLVSLPNSFVNLVNLLHLDITGTPWLKKIPLGIGALTGLQTLSKVIIDGSNSFRVSDLMGLTHLRGRISIEGLQNVKDAKLAMEAKLYQKKDLSDLELEWSDIFDDYRSKTSEYEVLEALKPHEKLKTLKILFYGGIKFPSWVEDPSFSSLTELTIRGCRSCARLPTLGCLRSLQKLFVESMNEVKKIGSDFLGGTNSSHGTAFPSLEVLEFKDMEGLEEWSIDGGENSGTITSFPCLREIYIANCPKLLLVSFCIAFPLLEVLEFKNMQCWETWSATASSFPSLSKITLHNCQKLDVVSIEFIRSLEVLHLQKCSTSVLRSMVSESSSVVKLTMENIKGLNQLPQEVLEHLAAVEYLCIKWCDELKYLWESESKVSKFLVNLKKLEVSFCKGLVSLGEEEFDSEITLKHVSEVSLRDCQRLKRYKCSHTIERLEIWNCPSLTSLMFPTVGKLPSSMKILDIRRCDSLEESWLLSSFLSPLQSLEMVGLHHWRSFPQGCFVHLTKLIVRGCDHIEFIPENGFGFLPLYYLEIIHCKNLKSFPYQYLPSLTSMKELSITHCPRIEDSFPCGMWPPNLSSLTIGGLKKPMSMWGDQNFPSSLVTLYLHGENSGVAPFAEADNNMKNDTSSFLLPSSITFLEINGFMHLKSLAKTLKHLACLEGLVIDACPKLGDLPEKLLPQLSSLKIYYCLKLQERCHSRNGIYRDILSQIPELYV